MIQKFATTCGSVQSKLLNLNHTSPPFSQGCASSSLQGGSLGNEGREKRTG